MRTPASGMQPALQHLTPPSLDVVKCLLVSAGEAEYRRQPSGGVFYLILQRDFPLIFLSSLRHIFPSPISYVLHRHTLTSDIHLMGGKSQYSEVVIPNKDNADRDSAAREIVGASARHTSSSSRAPSLCRHLWLLNIRRRKATD